ncbi:MAG TPA: tyrosine decarboxylase MfnA [Methanocella sp.]
MREDGAEEAEIFAELAVWKKKDVPYGRVLSSMCTAPHPVAVKAHEQFIRANLGDPKLFPGTAEIERVCVAMMGDLLHLTAATGYVTTGGTESNIQALRAAVQRQRAAVQRHGDIDRTKANIVVPDSAHYSFQKASQLLGVKLRRAPLDDSLRADPAEMAALVDKDTIALVAVAGTTEFGQVDPVEEIGRIAEEKDVFFHVDAAFGGFVIPFLKGCPPKFDFAVPGVSSVAIDPHKMGLSTIPSGGLLYRNAGLMQPLEINAQYLTSQVQTSLVGTRSGAAAAATYAVMRYLGRDGYRNIVAQCMENTALLVDLLGDIGLEPVIDPVMNIAAFDVPEPLAVRRKLCDYNWYVSTTVRPRALRMVVMPHVTEEVVRAFAADLKQVV